MHEWSHLAIRVKVDAEINVISIEINGTRQSRRIAQVGLKNAIGGRDAFRFTPHRIVVRSRRTGRGRASRRVETKKKRVATVRYVGAVGVNNFPLKVYLLVNTSGCFHRRSIEKSRERNAREK